MEYLSESVKSLGKILMAMFVTTAVLLFALAFLAQRLGLEEGGISIGVSVVYVGACFLGGFFVGKVQKTKKFIWGILIGMMYVVAMLAITLIVNKEFQATVSDFIVNLLICLGGGMLGGMLS